MKTVKNATEFARIYRKHFWDVDVEIYIYDGNNISDKEIGEYVTAIEKTLEGEYHFSLDGLGDRGFAFFADDANWNILDPILAEMEFRGCIVEFPDWYEWMSENAE